VTTGRALGAALLLAAQGCSLLLDFHQCDRDAQNTAFMKVRLESHHFLVAYSANRSSSSFSLRRL
jgi:hypothetical protein